MFKRFALSVMMLGALAACSDSPVGTDAGADDLRIVKVYNEAQFQAAGIAAPDARELLGRTRSGRLNPVRQLGAPAGDASFMYYCPVEPYDPYYYQERLPRDDCYPPEDCYSNPYGYNCGDPCQWDSSLPECQPPPPTVWAQFNFGSDAQGPWWVNRGGLLLKEISLTTFSEAIANVAFTTLDASFRNVGAQDGWGCGNSTGQFDSSHSSGSGSPLLLQSSRVANYLGTIKWEVWGTHGFTPVSGATGGGTFYSSDFVCG